MEEKNLIHHMLHILSDSKAFPPGDHRRRPTAFTVQLKSHCMTSVCETVLFFFFFVFKFTQYIYTIFMLKIWSVCVYIYIYIYIYISIQFMYMQKYDLRLICIHKLYILIILYFI